MSAVRGELAAAVLEALGDGQELTVPEIAKAVGARNIGMLRTTLARLREKFDVDCRRTRRLGVHCVVYRRAERKKPFLLGECWRVAFPVTDAGAV